MITLRHPLHPNYLLAGVVGPDNLQQWHHVCRTEEVGTDNAGGRASLGPNQVDVDGRGVGGEDAIGAAFALEVGEDALLEGDVLDDSLYDHIQPEDQEGKGEEEMIVRTI